MRSVPNGPLVGRSAETGLLVRVLERAAGGSGTTIALLGEAGIGKSALTRELSRIATDVGMPVLTGRAVLGPGTPAYRPLVEALLGGLHDSEENLRAPQLVPYAEELAGLLPSIATVGGPRRPPAEVTVELCEGVLRLLQVLAGDTGLLLVQEDLQWADDASLQVLEYLADHLSGSRILLLSTGRVDVPVPGIERLRALQARGAVTGMTLHPLDGDAIAGLAADTLGTDVDALPAGLVPWLREWSAGVPALVLDLLGAATERGLLPAADGFESQLLVPAQVAEAVRRQLAELEPAQLDVLRYATVLGREFDARLLSPLAGVESSEVDVLLGLLRDRQILEPWPGGGLYTHRFRRPIWHGALAGDLVGFQAEELAGTALGLVQEMHPGLPGPWCDYAAELAERAGDPRTAARLLAESGQRSLQAGAFGRAVAVLDRARAHLDDDALDPDRVPVDLLLLEALVDGGQLGRARGIGGALVETQQRIGTESRSRATARILLARAVDHGGEPVRAATHLAAARELAGTDGELLARVDLASALLRVPVPPEQAEPMARAVLAHPEWPAVLRCDAHRVLGRAALHRDLRVAEQEYGRALDIAEDHRLAHRRYAALYNLGRISALATFRPDGFERIRGGAQGAGAMRVGIELELSLSALRTLRMELGDGLDLALHSEEEARRLGLDATVPTAIAHQAVSHAFARRHDQLERCGATLLRMRGLDPDALATLWGQARAEYSLGRENRSQAMFELDTAMQHLEGTVGFPWPMRGLWVLLRAVENADAETARATVQQAGWAHVPLIAAHLRYAEAVERGRAGEPDAAMAAFDAAEALMTGLDGADWLHHRARRLVAEAAIADGWGEPTAWLRAALDSFARSGHVECVAACRMMLRRLGVPVPRQRRPVVPDALYQFGITVRELEVLGLIASRLSNAQIGRELFISTRTVEKHVERLLGKTSAMSRQELVAWAERTLGTQSAGRID